MAALKVDCFMLDAASDLATYKVTSGNPTASGEASVNAIFKDTDGKTAIQTWASAECGTYGVDTIPAGLWEFHMYTSIDSDAGTTQLICEVFIRQI